MLCMGCKSFVSVVVIVVSVHTVVVFVHIVVVSVCYGYVVFALSVFFM